MFFRGVVLTAAFLISLALGAHAQGTPAVEVSAILPLTGNLALLGQGLQRSLQAVERDTNAHGGIRGRQLRFVYLDDATNPQTAVQLANQVISQKAAVFFDGGPLATCKATVALAKDGPVDYCLSPALHAAPGSYAFSTSIDSRDNFVAIFRYYKLHHVERLAVLNPTDASGQEQDEYIKDIAQLPENRSISIVAFEHFNNTDLTTAAQVSRIMAAKPQAILIGASGGAFGTVVRSLNDAQNQLPVMTTNADMTFSQMNAFKALLPKELLFPAPLWAAKDVVHQKAVSQAVEHFIELNTSAGIPTDIASSLAYDPAIIVVAALRSLGPGATATQIRDYIDRQRDFPGANGTYDFSASPQRGLTIRDVVIVQWDPAKNTWVGVSGPGGGPR